MCGSILRARLMESVVLSAMRVVLRVGKCRVACLCARWMDARRFKRDRPPSIRHPPSQRGELFFFDWINEFENSRFRFVNDARGEKRAAKPNAIGMRGRDDAVDLNFAGSRRLEGSRFFLFVNLE